ncbi:hypothetical protein CLOM_g8207, partial [Closterium sp. NIES-68]
LANSPILLSLLLCSTVLSYSPFSEAVLVEQKQGEVLAKCAVEMGATDYNWSPKAPCTMDEGLVCNPDGTVNTIALSEVGLVGSVCSVIGNLTTLVKIDLSLNDLSGSIPASIGQLPLLQTLDLSYNSIGGVVPPAIGLLSSLQVLDLSYNSIGGVVPPAIGLLSSLRVLDLSYNAIEGAVPPAIGSLSSLQVLNLDINNVSGSLPPTMSQLSNLHTLHLANNSFEGPFPSVLTSLSSLTFLSLFYNNFSGDVPPSISHLWRLQSLDVGANDLTGEVLPAIASLRSLTSLDIAYNAFSGSIPSSFGQLTNMRHVVLLYNQFTGSIPGTLSALKKLSHIDFARNIFRGTIPSFFADLTNLNMLHFDGNQFSGYIPSVLGSLTKLTYLGFATNALSGTVPPTLGTLLRLTNLELNESGAVCPKGAGQPCVVKQTPSSQFCHWCKDFCSSCYSGPVPPPIPPPSMDAPPSSSPSSPSSSSGLSLGAIIGIAVGGVLVIALLVIGILLLYKRRPTQGPHEPEYGASDAHADEVSSMPSHAHMCQRFSFDTVSKSTNNWAQANHIGSGGYGEVYRGVSPVDPSVVWAVKRAKILTNDFKREVEEMASKSHPHLVRLLGYCVDMDMATEHHEQIVIYEFCSNGDLEKYLSGGTQKGTLTLQQRMEVLAGVARGLEYLHQFDIVHRDIKPANVLLDANMQAKVSDFGLVRMTEGTTVNPTRVVGTPGYVDPAYSRTNKATPMADVHSFGVLMLEVMLTKPTVIQESGQDTNIKDWAARCVQAQDAEGLRDPHLSATPDELLFQVVELALRCTDMPPSSRPHMTEVVARLDALSREFLTKGMSRADSRLQVIDKEIAARKPENSLDDEFVRIDRLSGACDEV